MRSTGESNMSRFAYGRCIDLLTGATVTAAFLAAGGLQTGWALTFALVSGCLQLLHPDFPS
jgi:hypothetical protein